MSTKSTNVKRLCKAPWEIKPHSPPSLYVVWYYDSGRWLTMIPIWSKHDALQIAAGLRLQGLTVMGTYHYPGDAKPCPVE